jgi:hypothetical protein
VLPGYDVKVLGPLPAAALAALGHLRIGTVEARTVFATPDAGADRLAELVSRLSALGLALSEVRRGPRHDELEIRGLLGPCLLAALSDDAVSVARWPCVLFLRLPARRLAEVLQVLTEQGVDLLGIRVASFVPATAGC